MAMPQRDEKFAADRMYDYQEYAELRSSFGLKPQKKSLWRYIPPMRAQYRIMLGFGMLLLTAGMAIMAFMSADSARLEYARQEFRANIAGLEQSITESEGKLVEAQKALYSGETVSPAEVIYPQETKYLVLSNVADTKGKRLVKDLYPLSKRLIELEP